MSRRNRMNKSRRINYKRKSRRLDNLFWIAGIFVLLSLVGFAGYSLMQANQEIEIDQTTLCPIDSHLINNHTIFMIDATDKLPKRYAVKAKKYISRIEREMNKFDRLTVVVLSDAEDNFVNEKFSMCSPGRGKDIDPMFGSKKLVEFKWKKTFHTPLKNLLNELSSLSEAKRTPLFEALSEVTSRLDFDDTVSNRKLFILSDMMHYTKEFSCYKGNCGTKMLNRAYIQDFDFDFSGIDIEIELIRREKLRRHQTQKFKTFWQKFFESYGAESVIMH